MSREIENEEFAKLLLACQEISQSFPEGLVYLGGIAVYLHAINDESTEPLAEFTHDADFYISISDMSDLRDIEEVTPNRRLSKHQLIKRGFEFDIYTERYSSLIVPYDQVIAHSVFCDSLRIAGLEHLFVLKLEDYRGRHQSVKGSKDAKDLIRIAMVAGAKTFQPELAVGYLSEEHLLLLERIEKGPEALALAKGNVKLAKSIRGQFSRLASVVRKG